MRSFVTLPKLRLSAATSLLTFVVLAAFSYNVFAYQGKGEQMTANANGPAAAKTLEVVVTRVFEAHVEQVWKAWSDSEQVMRWWGPTGFTSPVAKIDFRIGGVSLVCMRAPKEFGGQDMYSTWTYQKIEPLQRIEFIFHFSDKDGNRVEPATMGVPPGVPNAVPQVVTFKRLGENKTEMTITESGYTSEAAVTISKMGLEQCLDKMAASFKS